MKSLKTNVACFVLDLCMKQVEHYTKVIDSCKTLEQLNTTSGWVRAGFKKLESLAGKLPRRWRKLCVPALEPAKFLVYYAAFAKGLDIFQNEEDKTTASECSESETGDAVGTFFEALTEMFPGSVCCKVIVKRRKKDTEEPAAGSSTENSNPATDPADAPAPAETERAPADPDPAI